MNDYDIEIFPHIKKNYICRICGRKRTITYTKQCEAGGLLSNHGEQCMLIMKCPRCNNISMEEEHVFNWYNKLNGKLNDKIINRILKKSEMKE